MSRDAWIVCFAWFSGMGFAFLGLFPVDFNLYVLRLGYAPEFLGVLLSILNLTGAALGVPLGFLGSRFGTKPLAIFGMTLFAAGLAGLGISGEFAFEMARRGLTISAFVMGIGQAAFIANTPPLFTSVTDPEDRSVGFTLLALFLSVGVLAGSLAGGWIPDLLQERLELSTESPRPFQYPFIIASGVTLLGATALAGVRRTPPQAVRVPRSSKQLSVHASNGSWTARAPVLLIVLLAFVSASRIFATGIPRIYFNVFAERMLGFSVRSIGSALGTSQLITIPATFAVPFVAKRLGAKRAFAASTLLAVASAVLISLAPIGSAAVVALFAGNIGFAINSPIIDRFGQEAVPESYRPIVTGATITTINLWGAGFSLLAGRSISANNFALLFLLAGATTLASAVIFVGYFRKPRGEFASRANGADAE